MCNIVLALCPNTPEVWIYELQGGKWTKVHTLSEHTQVVTGIAWAPGSNSIVTAAQDRNAYVWELRDGTWEPTLVILRINRAATAVAWTADERKFAVSSGAKCIAVCYYDPEQNWWVSKHIKKGIRSTVLCLDWHPENTLIAAGTADFKARVYAAAIRKYDQKPSPGPWGDKFSWGNCMAEFDFGNSWVHDIKFSPSGLKLGWTTHDSAVHIAEASGNVSTVRSRDLPGTACLFLSDNTLVVGGHNCNLAVYTGADGGQWEYQTNLDLAKGKEKKKKTGTSAAFAKFQAADSLGQSSDKNDTDLKTAHQNTIKSLCPLEVSGTLVAKFSSAGLDGKVITWELPALEGANPALNIQ